MLVDDLWGIGGASIYRGRSYCCGFYGVFWSFRDLRGSRSLGGVVYVQAGRLITEGSQAFNCFLGPCASRHGL